MNVQSAMPISDAERALAYAARMVAGAPPSERIYALRDAASDLNPYVTAGWLNPAIAADKIYDIAAAHGIGQNPASEEARHVDEIARIAASTDAPPAENAPDPTGPEEYGLPSDGGTEPIHLDPVDQTQPEARLLLVCPGDWRDVPLEPMRWLATHRIPRGDVTSLSGDGGGGKTTVALQLALSVAADLGDWLGTTAESGPVIFLSGEEPQSEIRRRHERIARKRGLEPNEIADIHFHFADPDTALLGMPRRDGAMVGTPLFRSLCVAAAKIQPALIIVDNVAATYGGNMDDRLQVRTFVSLFRSLARREGCAVLLLDHPSLSGLTNNTGRGGSMDWQNAVRALMYMRKGETDDHGDAGREIEVMKINSGKPGEKIALRWEDGAFVIGTAASAPERAAANATVDDLFLKLLDKRITQGRRVYPAKGRGYAPSEFERDPEAEGVTARGFEAAMERLFTAGKIVSATSGPPSKRVVCIGRAGGTDV